MRNEMEMAMRYRMIITTLMLMATVVVSAQGLKTDVDEDRMVEIRKELALDYSKQDTLSARLMQN